MLFIKKSLLTEAVQWDGCDYAKVQIFCGDKTTGVIECKVKIENSKGEMLVPLGDWIIKDSDGELYPCKAEVFEKIFVKIEER